MYLVKFAYRIRFQSKTRTFFYQKYFLFEIPSNLLSIIDPKIFDIHLFFIFWKIYFDSVTIIYCTINYYNKYSIYHFWESGLSTRARLGHCRVEKFQPGDVRFGGAKSAETCFFRVLPTEFGLKGVVLRMGLENQNRLTSLWKKVKKHLLKSANWNPKP